MKPLHYITYEQHNPGGIWPLSDEHWEILDAAGWTVYWVKDHPTAFPWGLFAKNGRFLGAKAVKARGIFRGVEHAQKAFHEATGINPYDAQKHIFCCDEEVNDPIDLLIGSVNGN